MRHDRRGGPGQGRAHTLTAPRCYRRRILSGIVKGTLRLAGRMCPGDYQMEGKFEGDTLVIRAAAKGGPGGQCLPSLTLTQQGNKLIGTMGNGARVQLSR
jgi:hypothetical protein